MSGDTRSDALNGVQGMLEFRQKYSDPGTYPNRPGSTPSLWTAGQVKVS